MTTARELRLLVPISFDEVMIRQAIEDGNPYAHAPIDDGARIGFICGILSGYLMIGGRPDIAQALALVNDIEPMVRS
jgi:hypothetical protein